MSAPESTSTKNYIVSVHDDVPDDKFAGIKDEIKKLGGVITNEFSLIKAFSVKLPEITASSIKSFSGVKHVEEDGEVKTQA